MLHTIKVTDEDKCLCLRGTTLTIMPLQAGKIHAPRNSTNHRNITARITLENKVTGIAHKQPNSPKLDKTNLKSAQRQLASDASITYKQSIDQLSNL